MNQKELEQRIGKKNHDRFYLFMKGQTVGIIDGQYDYYEQDVERFMRLA